MTNPRHFTSFESFADAMAHDAIKLLPLPNTTDDYDVSRHKRAAIRDAMDAATERANDIWWHHVERCEDEFERGVGPAWD